jgi:hypothetical protein
VPPAPNVAVQRFRWIQLAFVAIKVAAILGLLVFLAYYYGGL